MAKIAKAPRKASVPSKIMTAPGAPDPNGMNSAGGNGVGGYGAGGLVSASRSIARAHEQAGGSPSDGARAEAERLREAAWSLA